MSQFIISYDTQTHKMLPNDRGNRQIFDITIDYILLLNKSILYTEEFWFGSFTKVLFMFDESKYNYSYKNPSGFFYRTTRHIVLH